jgi:hypothetical protein
MGSVNIDNTGSGADVTLSSDGTSLLLNGTAVGGTALELYAENPSSPTAPSATGTNAVAIGSNAVSTGINSIAMGNSRAVANGAVSIGVDNNNSLTGARSTNAIAIGKNANSVAVDAVAIGRGTVVIAQGAVGMGYEATVGATGATYAVALGRSYASGADSFAAAIANNTSSYGATGANSIAIGDRAKATGTDSIALGVVSSASGSAALAIGDAANATANDSIVIGNDSRAGNSRSMAFGTRSTTRATGQFVFGTGSLVAQGYAQYGNLVIHGRSGDATQQTLTSTSSLQSMDPAGNNNQLIVPQYGAIAFDGIIVARGQGSIGDTNSAAWKIEGLIRRESTNATTTLINSVIAIIDNQPGWGLELAADTTNGALSVKVTGAASTNVKWVCTLRSSETIYNTF